MVSVKERTNLSGRRATQTFNRHDLPAGGHDMHVATTTGTDTARYKPPSTAGAAPHRLCRGVARGAR